MLVCAIVGHVVVLHPVVWHMAFLVGCGCGLFPHSAVACRCGSSSRRRVSRFKLNDPNCREDLFMTAQQQCAVTLVNLLGHVFVLGCGLGWSANASGSEPSRRRRVSRFKLRAPNRMVDVFVMFV
jgi:hypothetical protein